MQAILETASGVGQMIGPALGGALYEVGEKNNKNKKKQKKNNNQPKKKKKNS